MSTTSFDPARAVRFDLAHGSVRSDGNDRLAIVPLDALLELARTGPATVIESIGHIIGRVVGARILKALGDVRTAPIEAFVSHLGGELALAGYGVASLERWGRAMVVAMSETALDEKLLAAILEGAFGTTAGRDVWCTPLMSERTGEGSTLRVLVSSKSAAERVRSWLRDNIAWGDALARLQASTGGKS
jgi:hypothetical protein